MQKKSKFVLAAIILLSVFLIVYIGYSVFMPPVGVKDQPINQSREILATVDLPQVEFAINMSVDQSLHNRRSVRRFIATPLSLKDVSQLLWAAQGITDFERNFRTTPSAGGVFPMEIYLVVGNNGVQELEAGIYHYNPFNHTLEMIVRVI